MIFDRGFALLHNKIPIIREQMTEKGFRTGSFHFERLLQFLHAVVRRVFWIAGGRVSVLVSGVHFVFRNTFRACQTCFFCEQRVP